MRKADYSDRIIGMVILYYNGFFSVTSVNSAENVISPPICQWECCSMFMRCKINDRLYCIKFYSDFFYFYSRTLFIYDNLFNNNKEKKVQWSTDESSWWKEREREKKKFGSKNLVIWRKYYHYSFIMSDYMMESDYFQKNFPSNSKT